MPGTNAGRASRWSSPRAIRNAVESKSEDSAAAHGEAGRSARGIPHETNDELRVVPAGLECLRDEWRQEKCGVTPADGCCDQMVAIQGDTVSCKCFRAPISSNVSPKLVDRWVPWPRPDVCHGSAA